MLHDFIQKIAPQESDPTMMWITDIYIQGLVIVFIVFGLVILVPVLKRWLQVSANRLSVKRALKSKEASQIGVPISTSFSLSSKTALPQTIVLPDSFSR